MKTKKLSPVMQADAAVPPPTDTELLDWLKENFFLANAQVAGTTCWEFYAPAMEGHNDLRQLLARAIAKQKG